MKIVINKYVKKLVYRCSLIPMGIVGMLALAITAICAIPLWFLTGIEFTPENALDYFIEKMEYLYNVGKLNNQPDDRRL